MVHDFISDDRYCGSSCGTENRSSPSRYRFGRAGGAYGRGRAALSRVSGYLKTVIEAIADSKLRRMQRELELRGIRVDPADGGPAVHKSKPAEQSR
jgi:hypothetical protein